MNRATLTFYSGNEDSYGEVTSKPNEWGHFIAIPGYTIAVDPQIIPYNSKVHIPALQEISYDGVACFFAHDTGSAVVAKVASKARGNDYPVIDVFMRASAGELLHLNDKFGNTVEYKIL